MTNLDYDERYVLEPPDNWDYYPPNAGAVSGTRVAYSNIGAFVRDYGVQLDRVGAESGQYLAVRENGVTSSFEQRALPISALGSRLYNYELTGHLPDGWTIEISEIARAFGREGGGAQVLIRDSDHIELSVQELVDAKVLK